MITGKGGAGKTTSAAILAHLFARKGYRVLAVDGDPQMNLPFALGVAEERAARIVPLAGNLEYIEEKTGARPGAGWGLMLRLNPDVDDVVERFGIRISDRISLLVMGTVVQAATGCMCPENTLLDAIVHHIVLREDEAILMDTQAGVEHFGRAIARGFRHALILTDASFNAVHVALHACRLAADLGIPHRCLVVNRVRNERDYDRVLELVEGNGAGLFTEIFALPYAPELLAIEPDVRPIIEDGYAGELLGKCVELTETLERQRCEPK